LENGYLVLTREWRAGDVVTLDFAMPVHTVRGDPQIAATRGRVAFERGPIVYCVEDPERKTVPADLLVPATAKMTARAQPNFLGGVTTLEWDGATAIPYYAWNNRGLSTMAVWLKRE
jgi:hypothetical protein